MIFRNPLFDLTFDFKITIRFDLNLFFSTDRCKTINRSLVLCPDRFQRFQRFFKKIEVFIKNKDSGVLLLGLYIVLEKL